MAKKGKSKVRKRDEINNQQKIDVPEKVIGGKNLCNVKLSSSVEEQNRAKRSSKCEKD